jgi:hypothetical protein
MSGAARSFLLGRIVRPAKSIRLSAIRDAPEGTIHFRGRVLCDEPLLEAPLSGRRCVFHDVRVEEYSDATGTVLRQLRGLPFRIEDGTGTALIAFQGAGPDLRAAVGPRFVECHIFRDVRESGGVFLRKKAPRSEALAREYGLIDYGLLGSHLAGAEGVIEVGDVVDVLGRGGRLIGPGGQSLGYRTPPEDYVVEATEDAPLILVKRRGRKVRR